MSKLFKLKEWLTIPEAAKYLSVILGDKVTEADVLRLGLDRHLKLSVNFVNHTEAQRGSVVTWEETEWYYTTPFIETQSNWPVLYLSGPASEEKILKTFPTRLKKIWNEVTADERKELIFIMRSHEIDNERFVNWEGEIVTIEGVWDLSMIGGERLDVEHAYQDLTGGPAVTLVAMDGCVVEKPDGQIYWLQEDGGYENDYKIDQPGTKVHLTWLKTVGEEKLGKIEVERLLSQHEDERKKFLLKDTREKTYFPAGGLPQDSVLVVRTTALREFEQKIADEDNKDMKGVKESTRKTDNLLSALTAIAIDDYGYDPESPKSNAPQDIADAMNKQGIIFDAKTIRNWLREGAALLPPKRDKN